MKRLGLVLMLAACGGGGSEKKPARTNAAPVSTTPAKMTREQVLVRVRAMRDRACACTDEACVMGAKGDFDSWADHPAPMSDDEIDKVVVAYGACVDGEADPMLVVESVVEMKNLMCACKDKMCAERVNDRYTDWGTQTAKRMAQSTHSKEKPPSAEAAKKMTKVAMAYGECMTNALAPTEAPAS